MFEFFKSKFGPFIFKVSTDVSSVKINKFPKRIDFIHKNPYKLFQILSIENTNWINTITTLFFEAIDNTPTDELTVWYGYSSYPLFGIIIYDTITETKTFKLPSIEHDETILVAPQKSFNSFIELVNDKNKCYDALLTGNLSIEPEGYVVHIFDDIINEIDIRIANEEEKNCDLNVCVSRQKQIEETPCSSSRRMYKKEGEKKKKFSIFKIYF